MAATGGAIGAAVGGTIGLVDSLIKLGFNKNQAEKVQTTIQNGGVVLGVNNHSEDELASILDNQKPDDVLVSKAD